jgi:hypothetical protein
MKEEIKLKKYRTLIQVLSITYLLIIIYYLTNGLGFPPTPTIAMGAVLIAIRNDMNRLQNKIK